MRLILALLAVLTLATADAYAFGKRSKGCHSGGCVVQTQTYSYVPAPSYNFVQSGEVKTCNGNTCGTVNNTFYYSGAPLHSFPGTRTTNSNSCPNCQK